MSRRDGGAPDAGAPRQAVFFAGAVPGCARCGPIGEAGLAAEDRVVLHREVKPGPDEAAVLAIERPDPKLWTYYALCCLVVLPAAPVLLPFHWFRYRSMRYHFTAEGVSMSWGILFRRQVLLNYARIQDIHLQSNIVERWLGLARLLVQTASGSAGAEMTIEGLQEFEAVRDFLYSKMRGVKDGQPVTATPMAGSSGTRDDSELAAALREVASELRQIREKLSKVDRHV